MMWFIRQTKLMRRKPSRANSRQRWLKPRIDPLEERIVPASFLSSILAIGVNNTFEDQSREAYVDVNNSGLFDVGDVVLGFVRIDDHAPITGGVGPVEDRIYAIFSQEVTEITPNGSNFDIDFGPTTVAGLTLSDITGVATPAGSIVAVYDSFTPMTNLINVSPGDETGNGTVNLFDYFQSILDNGTLQIIAGFGQADDFLFATTDDVAGANLITVGVGGLAGLSNSVTLANFSAGMSILVNNDPTIAYSETVLSSNLTAHQLVIARGALSGTAGLTNPSEWDNVNPDVIFSNPGGFSNDADFVVHPLRVEINNGGRITPTNVDCELFHENPDGSLLGAITYSVRSGKIHQDVNPGAFFYWQKFVHPAAGDSANDMVVAIQTLGSNDLAFFTPGNEMQVTLWDADCNKIVSAVVDLSMASQGIVKISADLTPGDTYFLAVKYDSKSIVGTNAPDGVNDFYEFETEVNGTNVGMAVNNNGQLPLVLKSPLHVAGNPVANGTSTTTINHSTLHEAIQAGIQYWRSLGIPESQLAALTSVDVRVDDLDGSLLGLAFSNGRIVLDIDAAGHGWTNGSAGGVNLTSVLAHEFGHLLGFDHNENSAVMSASLAPTAVNSVAAQPQQSLHVETSTTINTASALPENATTTTAAATISASMIDVASAQTQTFAGNQVVGVNRAENASPQTLDAVFANDSHSGNTAAVASNGAAASLALDEVFTDGKSSPTLGSSYEKAESLPMDMIEQLFEMEAELEPLEVAPKGENVPISAGYLIAAGMLLGTQLDGTKQRRRPSLPRS